MRLPYLKLVSGLVIGAIAVSVLILAICPQNTVNSTEKPLASISALCQGDAVDMGVHSMEMASGCLNFHIGAVQLFVNSLSLAVDTLLVSVLTIFTGIVSFYILAKSMGMAAEYIRLKHRYRLFIRSIRLLCQKKIMAWLSLFEYSHSASLVA